MLKYKLVVIVEHNMIGAFTGLKENVTEFTSLSHDYHESLTTCILTTIWEYCTT